MIAAQESWMHGAKRLRPHPGATLESISSAARGKWMQMSTKPGPRCR
jgi:hypothetical protein